MLGKNKSNIYLVIAIFFLILILFFSVIPGVEIGPARNSGFFSHIISYFMLSFVLSLYFFEKNTKKPLLKAALIAGSYGLLIEFIQFFIPYRFFEVKDILTNFAGAFLVMFIQFKKIKRN